MRYVIYRYSLFGSYHFVNKRHSHDKLPSIVPRNYSQYREGLYILRNTQLPTTQGCIAAIFYRKWRGARVMQAVLERARLHSPATTCWHSYLGMQSGKILFLIESKAYVNGLLFQNILTGL